MLNLREKEVTRFIDRRNIPTESPSLPARSLTFDYVNHNTEAEISIIFPEPVNLHSEIVNLQQEPHNSFQGLLDMRVVTIAVNNVDEPVMTITANAPYSTQTLSALMQHYSEKEQASIHFTENAYTELLRDMRQQILAAGLSSLDEVLEKPLKFVDDPSNPDTISLNYFLFVNKEEDSSAIQEKIKKLTADLNKICAQVETAPQLAIEKKRELLIQLTHVYSKLCTEISDASTVILFREEYPKRYPLEQQLPEFDLIAKNLSSAGVGFNELQKRNTQAQFKKRIEDCRVDVTNNERMLDTWEQGFLHLESVVPSFVRTVLEESASFDEESSYIGFTTEQLRLYEKCHGLAWLNLPERIKTLQPNFYPAFKTLLLEQLYHEARTYGDLQEIQRIIPKDKHLTHREVHKLGELFGFAAEIIVAEHNYEDIEPSASSIALHLPTIRILLFRNHFQIIVEAPTAPDQPTSYIMDVGADGNCGVYAVILAISVHILQHRDIYQTFVNKHENQQVVQPAETTMQHAIYPQPAQDGDYDGEYDVLSTATTTTSSENQQVVQPAETAVQHEIYPQSAQDGDYDVRPTTTTTTSSSASTTFTPTSPAQANWRSSGTLPRKKSPHTSITISISENREIYKITKAFDVVKNHSGFFKAYFADSEKQGLLSQKKLLIEWAKDKRTQNNALDEFLKALENAENNTNQNTFDAYKVGFQGCTRGPVTLMLQDNQKLIDLIQNLEESGQAILADWEQHFKKALVHQQLKSIHVTEVTFFAGLKSLIEQLSDKNLLNNNLSFQQRVDLRIFLYPYEQLLATYNTENRHALSDEISQDADEIMAIQGTINWVSNRLTVPFKQYFENCVVQSREFSAFLETSVSAENLKNLPILKQINSIVARLANYALLLDDLSKKLQNLVDMNEQASFVDAQENTKNLKRNFDTFNAEINEKIRKNEALQEKETAQQNKSLPDYYALEVQTVFECLRKVLLDDILQEKKTCLTNMPGLNTKIDDEQRIVKLLIAILKIKIANLPRQENKQPNKNSVQTQQRFSMNNISEDIQLLTSNESNNVDVFIPTTPDPVPELQSFTEQLDTINSFTSLNKAIKAFLAKMSSKKSYLEKIIPAPNKIFKQEFETVINFIQKWQALKHYATTISKIPNAFALEVIIKDLKNSKNKQQLPIGKKLVNHWDSIDAKLKQRLLNEQAPIPIKRKMPYGAATFSPIQNTAITTPKNRKRLRSLSHDGSPKLPPAEDTLELLKTNPAIRRLTFSDSSSELPELPTPFVQQKKLDPQSESTDDEMFLSKANSDSENMDEPQIFGIDLENEEILQSSGENDVSNLQKEQENERLEGKEQEDIFTSPESSIDESPIEMPVKVPFVPEEEVVEQPQPTLNSQQQSPLVSSNDAPKNLEEIKSDSFRESIQPVVPHSPVGNDRPGLSFTLGKETNGLKNILITFDSVHQNQISTEIDTIQNILNNCGLIAVSRKGKENAISISPCTADIFEKLTDHYAVAIDKDKIDPLLLEEIKTQKKAQPKNTFLNSRLKNASTSNNKKQVRFSLEEITGKPAIIITFPADKDMHYLAEQSIEITKILEGLAESVGVKPKPSKEKVPTIQVSPCSNLIFERLSNHYTSQSYTVDVNQQLISHNGALAQATEFMVTHADFYHAILENESKYLANDKNEEMQQKIVAFVKKIKDAFDGLAGEAEAIAREKAAFTQELLGFANLKKAKEEKKSNFKRKMLSAFQSNKAEEKKRAAISIQNFLIKHPEFFKVIPQTYKDEMENTPVINAWRQQQLQQPQPSEPETSDAAGKQKKPLVVIPLQQSLDSNSGMSSDDDNEKKNVPFKEEKPQRKSNLSTNNSDIESLFSSNSPSLSDAHPRNSLAFKQKKNRPSTRRTTAKKSKPVSTSEVVEKTIDHTVNKLADPASPALLDFNFIVFSSLVNTGLRTSIFSAGTNTALCTAWNHLDACLQLLIGIGQLSDERAHRRTVTKLKGLTNIASGTQLLALTAINSAVYGGPAFAAAFGVIFLLSIDEVYRRAKCCIYPDYWLADTKSELEKLREELARLTVINNHENRFNFFAGKLEPKIKELNDKIKMLDNYIADYNQSNPKEIPPKALEECQKDLIKALVNTVGSGIAFAGMVMACIPATTEIPAIVVMSITSGILLLKNSGLVDKFADWVVPTLAQSNDSSPFVHYQIPC